MNAQTTEMTEGLCTVSANEETTNLDFVDMRFRSSLGTGGAISEVVRHI